MPDRSHDAIFATRSSQIVGPSLRSTLRSAALTALAAASQTTGQTEKMLRRARVQILLLHHMFDDERESFRRLLKELARTHTFISYGDAVRRAQTAGGAIDRPYIAFTFDDGLKSCLSAAEILGEFGAVACHFVCPAIIGETDLRKIEAFCRARLKIPPVEFMTWDDLARLRGSGHEIGGHTMTHPRLADLQSAALHEEIAVSFQELRQRLGDVQHFAWTFGRFSDCSPQAVCEVYAAGYRTCASGERGCHSPARSRSSQQAAPLCIRRDHVLPNWPLSHTRYLLAKSSAAMSPTTGDWPLGWEQIIAGAA